MKKHVVLLVAIVMLLPLFTYAKSSTLLSVAIYHTPNEKVLSQLSARVWSVAASVMNQKFVLRQADSKAQALQWLQQKKVDVVVGPLKLQHTTPSIRYIDSYIPDSIGVVEPDRQKVGFIDTLEAFFEVVFGATVAVILGIICLFGVVLWIVERKQNKAMFPNNPLRGIGGSIWHCLVTFSTVGYGDIVAKTMLGRIIMAVWILISLILVSAFVASITSELTYIKTHQSKLVSLSQLYNKKVALVRTEPNVFDVAVRYHVRPVFVTSLPQLINEVADKTVKAGISNQYILQDYLNHHHKLKVTLTGYNVNYGSFSFALRARDPLISKLTNVLYTMSEIGRTRTEITSLLGTQLASKRP
ncbi:MAG: hypothetical protein COB66_04085 [Coxiella sp. (in: Bacteria)]|nr:MAG: hypothetical protein COB66_04085 [Coxiella sp. (in: g-proteobacteria)]